MEDCVLHFLLKGKAGGSTYVRTKLRTWTTRDAPTSTCKIQQKENAWTLCWP